MKKYMEGEIEEIGSNVKIISFRGWYRASVALIRGTSLELI